MAVEHRSDGPDALLAVPATPRCAVLVLSGSSGRVEVERVRLLADHGAAALSLRWFGDVGQPPGPRLVPLETFTPALDHLAGLSDHLAVLGASKGAEAALLLAARDARVRTVAALAPTSVVWEGIAPPGAPEAPSASSWTTDGSPLPHVPLDPTWVPPRHRHDDPVAYRDLYARSLAVAPDRAAAARIPVEDIGGEVLLAAGDDDRVWPSRDHARRVTETRAAHGLATTVVVGRGAGHRVRLPGEAPATGGMPLARGGSPLADESLGSRVWEELRRLLDLR